MQLFRFDRARARECIEDPDGALPPVNAFSDADELNGLLSAALAAGAIARDGSRACLYFYPMSPSEPEPLLAVDRGEDPALLGHPLKLREHDGENPADFTLRLLEDITSEANALAQARGGNTRPGQGGEAVDMNPLCPQCCSEDNAPIDRGSRLECGNCGAVFGREEALVTLVDAEAHAERATSCTCDSVRGCPQCFHRAEGLVGATVRDSHGRRWRVEDVGEKDGFPTIRGERYWDRPDEVKVIHEAA